MCGTCGCHDHPEIGIHVHEHPHHHHDHDHPHHHHDHEHPQNTPTKTVDVAQAVLSKNDRLAERNRGYFLAKNLWVLNLLSAPGSGKTTLLERTITDLQGKIATGVVVGDLETDNDAQRLRDRGIPSVQITTGTLCHLEADMVLHAAQHLDLDHLDVLVIENVGNLVCPAAYDLGENWRVALLSTTEGEDKPLKYPTLFKSADVVIINKIDIAEVVGFDQEKALNNIRRIAPQAQIFALSARTGEGMEQWYEALCRKVQALSPVG
ncbi:hydrogenase nickel incorporation protein HypB [Spirulina subsalsa]|uniref:hydrogenase nickel incorporation protein HypB n=1 Tax=Spirulina subsalsa TaxID=54311 RepID=UPI000303B567|nr:hydrogenase nickel incorporation protein HypB [Spirulina subsalsa]